MVATFPKIQARNLLGQELELPRGFEGNPSVVLVAFRRGQQRQVDSWIPWLEGQVRLHPGLRYYELPVLARIWVLFRPSIDGGMAAAIKDPVVLARTLTVYGNVLRVTQPLQIRRRSTISTFVVAADGSLRWRGEGGFDESLARDLAATLANN